MDPWERNKFIMAYEAERAKNPPLWSLDWERVRDVIADILTGNCQVVKIADSVYKIGDLELTIFDNGRLVENVFIARCGEAQADFWTFEKNPLNSFGSADRVELLRLLTNATT